MTQKGEHSSSNENGLSNEMPAPKAVQRKMKLPQMITTKGLQTGAYNATTQLQFVSSPHYKNQILSNNMEDSEM